MWKRKTEKKVSEVEDEAKTVEKTAINGKAILANKSPLALLRRDPVLRCEATRDDLTFHLVQNSPNKYNFTPVPVAMWSKEQVCGLLIAGTGVRIPQTTWMLVSCVCFLLSLRQADHSSRGVLPGMCMCVLVCLIVCDLKT